jgi:hypothetical protein
MQLPILCSGHGKCLKNVKGKTAGMVLTLVCFGTDCAGCGESTRISTRLYNTVISLAFVECLGLYKFLADDSVSLLNTYRH